MCCAQFIRFTDFFSEHNVAAQHIAGANAFGVGRFATTFLVRRAFNSAWLSSRSLGGIERPEQIRNQIVIAPMKTKWFKRFGWFYLPASVPGAVAYLFAVVFCFT